MAPSVSLGGIMMENRKGDDGPRNQGRIAQAEKIDAQKGGQ